MTNLYKELFIALLFAIIALFITEEVPIYVELDVYQKNITNSIPNVSMLEVEEKFYIYEGHNMLRRHLGETEDITVIIKGQNLLYNTLEYSIDDITFKESLHFGAIKRTIVIPVILELYTNYNNETTINESTTLSFSWNGPQYNGTEDYYEYIMIENRNLDYDYFETNSCFRTLNNSIRINCDDIGLEGNCSFLVRSCENDTLGPFTRTNISIDLVPPKIIINKLEKEYFIMIYDNGSGIKDWGIRNLSKNGWGEQNRSKLINIISENEKKVIGKITQDFSNRSEDEEIETDRLSIWVQDKNNHNYSEELEIIYLKKKSQFYPGGGGGGGSGSSKKPTVISIELIYPKNNSKDISLYNTLIWDSNPTIRDHIEYIIHLYKNNNLIYSIRTNKNEHLLPAELLSPNTTYYWYVKAEGDGVSNQSDIFIFTTANDTEPPSINISQDRIIVRRPEAELEVEVIDESGIKCLNYTIAGQYFDIPNPDESKIYKGFIKINTSLIPKDDYQLWFFAEDIYGNKNRTYIYLTVENSPPNEPWGLDPSKERRHLISPYNVTLRWIGGDQDQDDNVIYTIYLRDDGVEPVYKKSIEKLGRVTDCHLVIPFNLKLNTNYTWWVEVYDSENEYNISKNGSFETIADNSSPVIHVNPEDPHIYYAYNLLLDIYIADNESEIQLVNYSITDLESNAEISKGSLVADADRNPWRTTHDFNNSLIELFKKYTININAVNSANLNSSYSIKFTKLPVRIVLNCTGWNKNKSEEISGSWMDTCFENGSHIWRSAIKNNEVSYYFDWATNEKIDLDDWHYFSEFENYDNDPDTREGPRLNITIKNNGRMIGYWQGFDGVEITQINKTDLIYPKRFEVSYKYIHPVSQGKWNTMNIIHQYIEIWPTLSDTR